MNSLPLNNAVLRLDVKNKGHVVSFKNNKMVIAKSRGKPLARPLLITKPEFQQKMEAIIRDFVAQLSSMCPTVEDATATERCQLCSILLSKQCEGFDDSVGWIQEIHLKVERVPAGQEGATILLEKLL